MFSLKRKYLKNLVKNTKQSLIELNFNIIFQEFISVKYVRKRKISYINAYMCNLEKWYL